MRMSRNLLLLGIGAVAALGTGASALAKSKPGPSPFVQLPSAELKWEEFYPGGPVESFVIGSKDAKQGPTAFFIKFKGGFDSGWHGWFAPAKTPAVVVSRLYTSIVQALKDPKLREFLIAGGYEPRGDPPAEFSRIFRSDIKLYAEIVRAAKIETQ